MASALALAVLGGALSLTLQGQPPPPAPPDPAGPASLPAPGSDTVIRRDGDLLRFNRNVPGDAKPIVLDADEIYTWNEGDRLLLLLRGQVLVQQSVVQSRFPRGVACVDLKQYQATGILRMDLFADGGKGQVRLDTTLEAQEARQAVLSLTTRGEFRLRVQRGKVNRQDRSADPLVGRARALGVGPPTPQPSATVPAEIRPPVRPVSTLPASPRQPAPAATPSLVPAPPAKAGPPPTTGGGLRPMSFQEKTPGRTGPAAELVLAQAVEPGAPFPGTSPGSPRPPSVPVPIPMPKRPQGDGTNEPPPPMRPAPRPLPGRNDPEPPGPAFPPVPPPPPDDGLPFNPGGVTPIPPPSRPAAPPQAPPLPPDAPPRQYRILPRSGENFDLDIQKAPDGRSIITVTRGVILNVRNVPRIGSLDVEADRAVIWSKGGDTERIAGNLRSEQGESSSELEFYMAGHVTVRVQGLTGKEKSVLETDEIYYDTNRNVAVALNARLQIQTQRLNRTASPQTEPLVLVTPQLLQTSENVFEVYDAEISASKLPSDPGLKLIVGNATLEERKRLRTNLFGQPVIDPKTGQAKEINESILEARNVIAELEGVPFFYTPYLLTDAREPLGPLETVHLGGNRIFGFQAGVGLNVYKLLGVEPIEGTRWRVYLDYLSRRGPGTGTTFDYIGKLFPEAGTDLDALTGYYNGNVKLYGIYDRAQDILAGQPPQYFPFDPPGGRGRAFWRQQVLDLPYGFNVINQLSLLSDRNFLEQYYKREFDLEPNQANFVYVKQQQDNWAWSGLAQARTSNWITTTEWLPRADGYLIGQDLLGLLTSNTQVSAGYARLRPSHDLDLGLMGVPGPYIPAFPFTQPTTQRVDTGRAAVMQELSLPFALGPFKLVPYLKGAAAEYTNDLNGDERGRVWGGAGLRASIPFTRLYPDACSELFNVNGINHKVVASANYFVARANEPYTRFPQLDRLHDDATEQAMREFRPFEPAFNRDAGLALATSKLFDPQMYAIRRLVDNRLDTLDDIHVVQLDLRQRLQTKRGFPGSEHIIDWMVLETSVSYFPDSDRDNFGEPFSFFEYNFLWNIGDRTALESTGWYDPQDNGPRVYTVGMYFNRPDRTNFYIGYRQIEPLQSRLVTGSVAYVFSPKYAMTFTASYDFGVQESVTNSVLFTRTGTDLQVSLGFTYNTLQNNFGAIVEIVPNLIPGGRRGGLASGQSGGLVGR